MHMQARLAMIQSIIKLGPPATGEIYSINGKYRIDQQNQTGQSMKKTRILL
jgi:hypothetical protein